MATVGVVMVDRLEGIGRTAAHAATLILDRAAAVDPWWLLAGTLLYILAQSVRPLGWHTILRAAYPDATGLRRADTVRAYLAGSGINSVIPARGGDVAKLAMVHRRIEGARYPVLVATFVPETIFETAFGTGLVVWALARGFLPVPTTSGELPSLDVSLVVEHPIQAAVIVAVATAAAWLFIRFLKGSVRQGLAILGSPRLFVTGVASWQALARLIRLTSLAAFMTAFHLPVTPATVVLVMAAQGGGRILPFAPVSAGLRLAMLSYGFVEVTGKSVDIAQITAFSFGVGAVLSVSGLLVAAAILLREFGTLSPRGAIAAARERIPGAPWRRPLPDSAT